MSKIQIKKSILTLLATLFLGTGLLLTIPAETQGASFLQDAQTKVEATNYKAGLPESNDPSIMVGKIIKYMLGFIGTIFVVLIIYGGFTWMTAGGNEENVAKAKRVITQASIGLLVVMLSYAISLYIIDIIVEASDTPSVSE